MKKPVLVTFILLLGSLLWAQNRYALVIGNANYTRADDRLPNAINDTNDISAALRGLGYAVELKQNLRRLDMIREIDAFIARLRSNRNSEGFFWYAGHAMELEGENLLLPLDVDLESENLIKATSYSVTGLTRQFEGVRNKINVVVLDACRVPPAIGGGTRAGIRIETITPPDRFVFYSTTAGDLAVDGNGRNSPFASAFLNNINKNEPLNLLAVDIVSETYRMTSQTQRPSYDSRITLNKNYSIASRNFTKRYALLIGNSNYRSGQKLQNPVNDVQDIAKALIQLGYEVDLKIDASLAEMESAIANLKRRLATEKESEGFFWYAGHGVQFDEEMYLLPVDVDVNISSESQLRSRTVSLSLIFDEIESAHNKINIFFLDAARNNPFGGSSTR